MFELDLDLFWSCFGFNLEPALVSVWISGQLIRGEIICIRRGRSTTGHKCPGQDVLARTSETGSKVLARTFVSYCTSAPSYLQIPGRSLS